MRARSRVVMHPTDFSPASRGAFRRAVREAKAAGGELLLVHVVSTVTPFVGDHYMSPQTYVELQRSMRVGAQKQLDRLVARAKAAGARARGLLVEGAPADTIVRTARARRAAVIVMGTHGRT